ncbi:hypothetical protein [Sphingomonas sp. PB4P5]|uniref:hypothetical protein n=1 Tax=Parasphingomonas puruogangriensis TaxID=3096155 RepID=UPI002FC95DEA
MAKITTTKNEKMSMLFKPAAGHHAIDRCSVVIGFAQPVDPETFSLIVSQAGKIAAANELPGSALGGAAQGVFTSLGQAIPQMIPQAVFQRFAPDGNVDAQLVLTDRSITYTLREYNGWPALLKYLGRTVLEILPSYLGIIPAISNVTLQYEDRFVAVGDMRPSAGEVFVPNSKWLSAHDRTTEQEWHSHFGIFLPVNDHHRQLVNVNAGVADAPAGEGAASTRHVTLMLMVAQQFDIPGQPPLVVDPADAAAAVRELLDGAHCRHKQLLKEVLAKDYLTVIGIVEEHDVQH